MFFVFCLSYLKVVCFFLWLLIFACLLVPVLWCCSSFIYCPSGLVKNIALNDVIYFFGGFYNKGPNGFVSCTLNGLTFFTIFGFALSTEEDHGAQQVILRLPW